MSKPVISVENLSKAYRIGLKEEIPDTFFDAATGWLTAPLRNWRRLRRLNTFQGLAVSSQPLAVSGQTKDGTASAELSTLNSQRSTPPESDLYWALTNVSFEVQQGEVIGIIGRNGAGKSTLLKILSRITEPTSGRAVLRGRVSSLLEVGTGFHPELTGRENVYMNGTILGMTKREIDRKFDEIVDFAGVETFLDTPVKRYSSGMQVRLAFAVAAHLEPEILIIDEVLAVGDADFQNRCLGKMQDVAASGRTVLFVSHNVTAVENLCTRSILLSRGEIESVGAVSSLISSYLHSTTKRPSAESPLLVPDHSIFTSVGARDGTTSSPLSAIAGGPIIFEIEYRESTTLEPLDFAIAIESMSGTPICYLNPRYQMLEYRGPHLGGKARCVIPRFTLIPGQYLVSFYCSASGVRIDQLERILVITIHASDYYGTGRLPPPKRGPVLIDAEWTLALGNTH